MRSAVFVGVLVGACLVLVPQGFAQTEGSAEAESPADTDGFAPSDADAMSPEPAATEDFGDPEPYTPPPASEAPPGPVTGEKLILSMGASAGYGLEVSNDVAANPFGVALRPRIGVTLAELIYFGALANFALGESVDVSVFDPATQTSGNGTLSSSAFFFGAEVGVDLAVAERVLVRPTYAMGATLLSAEACDAANACVATSETFTSLQFGVQLLARFGALYGGLDAAYLIVARKRGINPSDEAFFGLALGAMFDFQI